MRAARLLQSGAGRASPDALLAPGPSGVPSLPGKPGSRRFWAPSGTFSMGFRLEPCDSTSVHESLLVRATHPVSCVGATASLLTLCAELDRLATSGSDGVRTLPYWTVCLIGLPLVGPCQDEVSTEWAVELWSRFIDPSKLGAPVELVLASSHFDRARAYSLAGLLSALRAARDAVTNDSSSASAAAVFSLHAGDLLKAGVRARGHAQCPSLSKWILGDRWR